MKKRSSILILFLFTVTAFFAQKAQEALGLKTWYSNVAFGSDNVILSTDNGNNSLYEIRFSVTGKLVLKHLKKKLFDTAATYFVKKNNLTVKLNYKDSSKIFEYKIRRISGNQAYELNLTASSKYFKRKGDDTIVTKLVLTQGTKRKVIKNMQSVIVFSKKRALKNDSIDFAIWGQLVGYIADTLIIDCDQYIEHNFYKKHPDSLHYISPELYDTVIRIKVPVREVTKIYTQRESFTSVTNGLTYTALGTGLVFIGGSLIFNDKDFGSNLGAIGVVSLLTIPFSFGTGLIFATEKYYLIATEKQSKTWKVERRMPHKIEIKHKPKPVNKKS
ncbi:hypothetical protein CNR22_05540 [Sphingobacteriaceae bacterium]|nr:hypothetical protein CNR22_05540 [Sphingobacteriaceae bacterium]